MLKAQDWYKQIHENKLMSLTELGNKEHLKELSYVRFIYSLNYLAPDIKKNIFTGNIKDYFTLQSIKNQMIPIERKEQRELYVI